MKPKPNIGRDTDCYIKDTIEFDLSLPPYKKKTLANGVEVYCIDLGNSPSTMITWIFDAGMLWEEKKLVATISNALLKSGTRTRSALGIGEHFKYYGTYTSGFVQYETAEFTIGCLNKSLGEVLPVVADILSNSAYPQHEIEEFVKGGRQNLQLHLQRRDFIANRLMNSYLYGKQHPLGKPTVAEDYLGPRQSDITNFFDRFYRQGGCRIIAAGQLPGDVITRLDSAFGFLPIHPIDRIGSNRRSFPIMPAACKKYVISSGLEASECSIRIARSLPNQHHPDFIRLPMLNIVFGGYIGSRLKNNIRKAKGYGYEIHSFLINNSHDGCLVVVVEAAKEVCSFVIAEVYKEMNRLRKDLIGESELQKARDFAISSFLDDLKDPFKVAALWKSILLNRQGDGYFADHIQVIKTITPDEIQELAIKYLEPNDFFELTVI